MESLNRTGVADMAMCGSFRYTALRTELVLAGVYVRHYAADPTAAPPEEPARLARALRLAPLLLEALRLSDTRALKEALFLLEMRALEEALALRLAEALA